MGRKVYFPIHEWLKFMVNVGNIHGASLHISKLSLLCGLDQTSRGQLGCSRKLGSVVIGSMAYFTDPKKMGGIPWGEITHGHPNPSPNLGEVNCAPKFFQGKFQGPPKTWDPLMVSFLYYSHIFRDSYGSGMGIVWEAYHKGVPCPWGSLKIPLKNSSMLRITHQVWPLHHRLIQQVVSDWS